MLKDKAILHNSTVQFALRLIALERYVDADQSEEQKWYKLGTSSTVIEPFAMTGVSQVMQLVLCYIILSVSKHQKWSFHVGTVSSNMYEMELWYLRGRDMIVSQLDENSAKKVVFSMDDTPICDPSDLLEQELKYMTSAKNAEPVPHERESIMKWFRDQGFITDSNKVTLFTVIVTSLTPGSDFKHILRSAGKLWDSSEAQLNRVLLGSILKTKIVRGVKKIFEKYPPLC